MKLNDVNKKEEEDEITNHCCCELNIKAYYKEYCYEMLISQNTCFVSCDLAYESRSKRKQKIHMG